MKSWQCLGNLWSLTDRDVQIPHEVLAIRKSECCRKTAARLPRFESQNDARQIGSGSSSGDINSRWPRSIVPCQPPNR